MNTCYVTVISSGFACFQYLDERCEGMWGVSQISTQVSRSRKKRLHSWLVWFLVSLAVRKQSHRRDEGDSPAYSGADNRRPLVSERRAEDQPLKQVLNKPSGRDSVCGFSIQMVLPLAFCRSPEWCMSSTASLSDLSVQGEIRPSLSLSANPFSHRWRMASVWLIDKKVFSVGIDYTPIYTAAISRLWGLNRWREN